MMSNFFRCRIGIVQRSKNGSAIARAAYQACTKMMAPDGTEYDFTGNRETHGHRKTIILAPSDCPDWAHDPQQLWERAVRAETRCNAQEARIFEIALPRELPPELWDEAIRAMLAPFAEDGAILQVDIHVTPASDGGLNPHIHVIATLRRIEGNEFARKKAREWNAKFWGHAQQIRIEIADRLNTFCKRHNVRYHADPRSNEERGLPEAEFTLPRWNILRAKRTGKRTAWLLENEAHRVSRRSISELEEELKQIERAIQVEQEQVTKDEQRGAAGIEAFIRRRAHLAKSERREALARRQCAENFETLPSVLPDLSGNYSEPSCPIPR
jgi:hypothetical protein